MYVCRYPLFLPSMEPERMFFLTISTYTYATRVSLITSILYCLLLDCIQGLPTYSFSNCFHRSRSLSKRLPEFGNFPRNTIPPMHYFWKQERASYRWDNFNLKLFHVCYKLSTAICDKAVIQHLQQWLLRHWSSSALASCLWLPLSWSPSVSHPYNLLTRFASNITIFQVLITPEPCPRRFVRTTVEEIPVNSQSAPM